MAAAILSTPIAYCEPCYCDRCDGTSKFLGELCTLCEAPRWGCRSMPCDCMLPLHCACGEIMGISQDVCSTCWFAEFRKRRDAATIIQALYRGHISRKKTAERNADEVRAVTPLWRTYDEEYKMNAICQTIEAQLKKDDATWDATSTPYYRWMSEHSRGIDEMETYLRRRGWVRPKKTRFRHPSLFFKMVKGVLRSNNVSAAEERLFMVQMEALVQKH